MYLLDLPEDIFSNSILVFTSCRFDDLLSEDILVPT